MDKRKSSGGKEWNSHPLSGFDGGDVPSAEEEIEELARIIYAEAGGSDEDTKAMIGWSVRNRLNKRGYPDTYTGVIHEKKNGIKQYEAVGGKRWNKIDDLAKLPSDESKEYRDYRRSYEVAKGVYNGSIPDSSGVEFFHSFKDPEKVTGFFRDAVKDGRISPIGERGGFHFFKDNTR